MGREVESRTLVKALEAVEISVITGGLTLLQRRIFNCLYLFASPALLEREIHSVPMAQLVHELHYTSRNTSHLISGLLGLTQVQVRWNYFGVGAKRNALGASPMLAQAEVIGPIVYFAFPPKIRAILHAAARPALIEFDVQRQLTSSYSHALYELLAASVGVKQGEHLTAIYELGDLRRLLDIPEQSETYQRFRYLNSRVLQPAITEVSNVSPYVVEALTFKQGRTITALQFRLTPKPGTTGTPTQRDPATRMEQLGCSPSQIARFLTQYPTEYLEGNLAYVEAQWTQGRVKRETPVPLLCEALRADYRPRVVTLPRLATGAERGTGTAELSDLKQSYYQERKTALAEELRTLAPDKKDQLERGFLVYIEHKQPALLPAYRLKGLDSVVVRAAFMEYIFDPACPFRLLEFPSLVDWLAQHRLQHASSRGL